MLKATLLKPKTDVRLRYGWVFFTHLQYKGQSFPIQTVRCISAIILLVAPFPFRQKNSTISVPSHQTPYPSIVPSHGSISDTLTPLLQMSFVKDTPNWLERLHTVLLELRRKKRPKTVIKLICTLRYYRMNCKKTNLFIINKPRTL